MSAAQCSIANQSDAEADPMPVKPVKVTNKATKEPTAMMGPGQAGEYPSEAHFSVKQRNLLRSLREGGDTDGEKKKDKKKKDKKEPKLKKTKNAPIAANAAKSGRTPKTRQLVNEEEVLALQSTLKLDAELGGVLGG